MNIVLFDNDFRRKDLFPLTLTRPVADLRVGILTIAEKWQKWLNASFSFATADYLAAKYPLSLTSDDVLLIDGGVCPDSRLAEAISTLREGDALMGEQIIAVRMKGTDVVGYTGNQERQFRPVTYHHPFTKICYPEDIFMYNREQIQLDFERITKGRLSAPIDSSNRLIGDRFFAEEGAVAMASTINTLQGPVYLGKNAEIWEGSLVRGSFGLCEGSQLKMGTKVYSNVTVGPYSRVGGELNTCVIWGNSSKGHEGYFGSGVMGEWCNWGADTNNSNMKNNYKNVRLYHYPSGQYRDTGLQFCGLIMADHAKCAINTAFNTGTVVGVSAHILGAGMPPAFVPDFSWGGAAGLVTYELSKMFETAALVFERRNRTFDTVEKDLLRSVFKLTGTHRSHF